jgi:hypothetical protein
MARCAIGNRKRVAREWQWAPRKFPFQLAQRTGSSEIYPISANLSDAELTNALRCSTIVVQRGKTCQPDDQITP